MQSHVAMRPERRASRSSRAISIVLGIVIAIGGLLALGYGLQDVQKCRQLANGLQAPASVLESSVTMHRGSKGRKYYRVLVRFQYEHAGTKYSSQTPFVETYETSNAGEAQRVADAFAPGTAQTAYFLASTPDRAVLDPRVTRQVVIPILLGVGALGIGGLIAALGGYGRSYPEPDLPVNTARTPEGYVIRPSTGPRLSALIFGCICTLVALISGAVGLPDWPTEPSLLYMLLVCAGGLAAPIIAWLVVRIWVSEDSGGVFVDHQEGVLRQAGFRAQSRPIFSIPLARITDARMAFARSKHSRDPKKADANFTLTLTHLRDDGTTKVRKFASHSFTRDDAAELELWLRHALALDVTGV